MAYRTQKESGNVSALGSDSKIRAIESGDGKGVEEQSEVNVGNPHSFSLDMHSAEPVWKLEDA